MASIQVIRKNQRRHRSDPRSGRASVPRFIAPLPVTIGRRGLAHVDYDCPRCAKRHYCTPVECYSIVLCPLTRQKSVLVLEGGDPWP